MQWREPRPILEMLQINSSAHSHYTKDTIQNDKCSTLGSFSKVGFHGYLALLKILIEYYAHKPLLVTDSGSSQSK